MKKVISLSLLLLAGMLLSQGLPGFAGSAFPALSAAITVATMLGLAFIMIRVGLEFDLDKGNLRPYAKDYLVAATAATFPWLLVSAYFVWVLLPASAEPGAAWKESLLAGRFAAPTSAGVLFSMLAAAGLGATWLFRKARVLAIFDDLDTVLLLIPLKMFILGFAWEMSAVVVLMLVQVLLGWFWFRRLSAPVSRFALLGYAAAIVAVSETIYLASKNFGTDVPIHIEVLLPAFVLGCVLRDDPARHHDPKETRFAYVVSSVFIFLVGLGMPLLGGETAPGAEPVAALGAVSSGQPAMSRWAIAGHVLAVTVLSNLGKMFPALCYRREASVRERLALAIAMWPRGEVGAGILVLSLGYGLGGPMISVAVLSLALNLVCTGVFILVVRRLLSGPSAPLHPAETKGLSQ